MIEAKGFYERRERSVVGVFIPDLRLREILDNFPQDDQTRYLSDAFRRLLKGWGTDFDLPFLDRPIPHAFRKTLLRRAAVQVSHNSTTSLFLVIDTDSLTENVQSGKPLPNDPETADIKIWPLKLVRKKESDKPWVLGVSPQPNLYTPRIYLKNLGRTDWVVVDTTHRVHSDSQSQVAVNVIRNWTGLH